MNKQHFKFIRELSLKKLWAFHPEYKGQKKPQIKPGTLEDYCYLNQQRKMVQITEKIMDTSYYDELNITKFGANIKEKYAKEIEEAKLTCKS